MADGQPEPVARDSRGILDPALLRARLELNRYPADGPLEGVVDRFWAITWDLPPGEEHVQQILTHPCANLAVQTGPATNAVTRNRAAADVTHAVEAGPVATLHGVTRRRTENRLSGRGWVVAAMTTVGGLGALQPGPATVLTDRVTPLEPLLGEHGAGLADAVAAAPDEPGRAKVLAERLADAVTAADPARVAAAREVAAMARLAETDRSVRRLADLVHVAGATTRTVQRMFTEHAGVPATWVIRRYRLLEAAEAVRDGRPVSWAEVAADLGYADQPHLTRDFHAALGLPPAAYARRQAALRDTTPG